jgi:hypothetical protein
LRFEPPPKLGISWELGPEGGVVVRAVIEGSLADKKPEVPRPASAAAAIAVPHAMGSCRLLQLVATDNA